MKTASIAFAFVFAWASATAAPDPKAPIPIDPGSFDRPIRVACVGDSITAGSGIQGAENSYPGQLGSMLGEEEWTVKNFGVSGATMMDSGDKPYRMQPVFKAALEMDPDVVVIKLGTNDTKPHNWKHSADFQNDAKALIAAFREVNPQVRIYLCTPAPAFPENFGIRESVISGEVVPAIRKLAEEEDLPLIDLHSALKDRADLFKDKVHPDKDGATIIAEEVHKVLTGKPAPRAPVAQ